VSTTNGAVADVQVEISQEEGAKRVLALSDLEHALLIDDKLLEGVRLQGAAARKGIVQR